MKIICIKAFPERFTVGKTYFSFITHKVLAVADDQGDYHIVANDQNEPEATEFFREHFQIVELGVPDREPRKFKCVRSVEDMFIAGNVYEEVFAEITAEDIEDGIPETGLFVIDESDSGHCIADDKENPYLDDFFIANFREIP